MLKQAEKDTGEPSWEQLQALDVPVPVLVFTSVGDGLWSPLDRDDVEAVFRALTENVWSPSGSSSVALN